MVVRRGRAASILGGMVLSCSGGSPRAGLPKIPPSPVPLHLTRLLNCPWGGSWPCANHGRTQSFVQAFCNPWCAAGWMCERNAR